MFAYDPGFLCLFMVLLWSFHPYPTRLPCLGRGHSSSDEVALTHMNKWIALLQHHNGHDGVSNHQPRDCLFNRLFRRRSKKTSKLRVTRLCVGNSPEIGEFPAQMAGMAENYFIWWRHHGLKPISIIYTTQTQTCTYFTIYTTDSGLWYTYSVTKLPWWSLSRGTVSWSLWLSNLEDWWRSWQLTNLPWGKSRIAKVDL